MRQRSSDRPVPIAVGFVSGPQRRSDVRRFGEALESEAAVPQVWMEFMRMGWLTPFMRVSAMHRGRTLQADVMLGHRREQIIALASYRAGLNTRHAREAHLLPDQLQAEIAGARPSTSASRSYLQLAPGRVTRIWRS